MSETVMPLQKPFVDGAKWADISMINKALKAFCYANCTEPTKKGVECEKPCKEFLIFKRIMEE